MPTYKTQGIVLAKKNLGERDRLIIIFSENFGKLRLLAKGVRRIHSKRAPALDLSNLCQFLIAKGKTIDIIAEVELVNSFVSIKDNLEKQAALFYILEHCERLTPDNERQPQNFHLLKETLEQLEKTDWSNITLLRLSFAIKFLKNLGYWSIGQLPLVDLSKREALKSLEEASYPLVNSWGFDDKMIERIEILLKVKVEEILGEELKSTKFLRIIQ